MLAFAAAREGNPFGLHWTPLAIGCLLYLALAGSVAATWLNYWLLERMSATALLSMALVEPLIAVLLGAAFLHERVTPGAALGGVLVLCSIFMITISFREEPHVKRVRRLTRRPGPPASPACSPAGGRGAARRAERHAALPLDQGGRRAPTGCDPDDQPGVRGCRVAGDVTLSRR